MEPEKFLQTELIPVIDRMRRRDLIDLEEKYELSSEGFAMRLTLVSGAFKYLKDYLEGYIFPKMFAFDVRFDTYAFGKVTNRQNRMHIEVVMTFEQSSTS